MGGGTYSRFFYGGRPIREQWRDNAYSAIANNRGESYRIEQFGTPGRLIEAQIHGGITASDIREIQFPSEASRKRFAKRVQALGLTTVVVRPEAAPGKAVAPFENESSAQQSPAASHPGERGSAPMLTDLTNALVNKFGKEDAPKANYKGLGGLKRLLLPGQSLAEVEKADRQVFEAAIRTGGSMSQASVVLHSAMPAIMKALKGTPVTWDQMALAYDESRLRGIRDRWQDFAQQARDMTDEDLQKFIYGHYDADHPNPTIEMLSNIEGRAGLAQDLGQSAMALAQAQDWDTLRDFLEQTFNDAANRVHVMMDPAEFDHVTGLMQSNPKVQEAHQVYKDQVEAVMAKNHALNEGVFLVVGHFENLTT